MYPASKDAVDALLREVVEARQRVAETHQSGGGVPSQTRATAARAVTGPTKFPVPL